MGYSRMRTASAYIKPRGMRNTLKEKAYFDHLQGGTVGDSFFISFLILG